MTKTILPPEALAQHVAVLGKTGSGKTSTGKLIIEQVAADGARVCVLDPIKSDWWGMTSSVDGKKCGLPFHILGGPRGHVPLHAQAGKAIGEIVASGALPLSIIDMADFGPGDHMRFFCDFAQTLLRKQRGVLYLVIEEAHEFAPKERSGIGAENMGIYWAKKIATAGRSKGIRMMVLTQRTQSLHNALLGSCETVIAHKFTAPADQKPVLDWLKANVPPGIQQMVSAQLSSLKTGSGWICSPGAEIFERRDFPRIKTYDNSATPTDDDKAQEVQTAAVDTDKLRLIIGDAVKEAEANDPKKLRARIAELEREAKKGHAAPAVDPAAIAAAEQQAYERGWHEGREAGFRGAAVASALAVRNFSETLKNIEDNKENSKKIPGSVKHSDQFAKKARSPSSAPAPARASAPQPRASTGDPVALPVGERATLIACAQTPGGCTREQLTILTGYKRSTRDAYIQRLREKGYAEAGRESITATAAGIDALGSSYEPLPTGAALREYWIGRLPDGERKVLQVILDRHPDTVERDTIDDQTGFKRSTRDAYIQRLKTRQLVKVYRDGITAADALFD